MGLFVCLNMKHRTIYDLHKLPLSLIIKGRLYAKGSVILPPCGIQFRVVGIQQIDNANA